jgi:hypothetical protein
MNKFFRIISVFLLVFLIVSTFSCASLERKFREFDERQRVLHSAYIGMSESELITYGPKPEKINATHTRYGVSKQYVFVDNRKYSSQYKNYMYIYTENGVITGIQK